MTIEELIVGIIPKVKTFKIKFLVLKKSFNDGFELITLIKYF